ncbi:MAG: DUF5916 domain-containing protein [Pseudomonadota bacterium]
MAKSPIFAGLACALFSVAASGEDATSALQPPSARAVFAAKAPHIDGVLDEAAWTVGPVQSGLIQRQPFVGRPASETTEFRVLFDEKSLYVGILCRDREPAKIIGRSRRLDSNRIYEDDYVSVNIDSALDHRTVYGFTMNPLGAMIDGKGLNNGEDFLVTWDAVWEGATRVTEEGWTAEFRIPFTSLEYDPSASRTLGLNVTRFIARRNEADDWAPIPPPFDAFEALYYGHLEGLSIQLRRWRELSFFPSIAGGFDQSPPAGKDFVLRPSLGLKLPLTRTAILQGTVKTDFSQVEIDDAQINLNRFNLFFSELRPFFLDGAQFFDFGVPGVTELFFSRRIGLDSNGQTVPILLGTRSYGILGKSEYGALDIQTESSGGSVAENFSVGRFRQDIGPNSNVGVILTHRQEVKGDEAHNTVAGADVNLKSADARWSFTGFGGGSYSDPNQAGATVTSGGVGYSKLAWSSKDWEFYQANTYIAQDFDPQVGFVQRAGIYEPELWLARDLRFPNRGVQLLRFGLYGQQFFNDSVDQAIDYYYEGSSTLLTNGGFQVVGTGQRQSDKVLTPFDLKPGVTVPTGRYSETQYAISFTTPQQYDVAGQFKYLTGGYFGGRIHHFQPKVMLRPFTALYLRTAADVALIGIDRLGAAYTATALNFTGHYSFTTKMFLEANAAWNSVQDALTLQYRYRYRFLPLSDFYIIYREQRTASSMDTVFRELLFKIAVYFAR